jgi:hypothetical protein
VRKARRLTRGAAGEQFGDLILRGGLTPITKGAPAITGLSIQDAFYFDSVSPGRYRLQVYPAGTTSRQVTMLKDKVRIVKLKLLGRHAIGAVLRMPRG